MNMNILDIFRNYGLEPKQKTASEWAAPCPVCGGDDRCILRPNHSTGTGGRYWCRQCDTKGDVIEFLQKFGGMSKKEALEKTKGSLAGRERPYSRSNQASSFPARPQEPPEEWITAAGDFLSRCQTNKALLSAKAIEKITADRFIPPDYAREFGIGWHERDEYVERKAWGLPEDGERKKILLPAGIVIATRRKIGVVSLTVRRIGHKEKYRDIAGGAVDVPYIPKFELNKPIFLLESALDAALLCCEAGEICNAVGLRGTDKKIDANTMAFIKQAPLIIVSPDRDDAGDKARDHWQQLFPSAWAYRAEYAKDIGEMHKLAMSGKRHIPTAGEWAIHAIEYCRQKRS